MKLNFKSYAFCLLAVISIIGFLCSCSNHSEQKGCYPVEEQSYFDGYEITNDRIKFRYSIHFVNELDSQCDVAIYAAFDESELSDWVKNDDADSKGNQFEGLNEDCSDRLTVKLKAHESKDVIFTFEGKYLGGKVNENLSFPTDIILLG